MLHFQTYCCCCCGCHPFVQAAQSSSTLVARARPGLEDLDQPQLIGFIDRALPTVAAPRRASIAARMHGQGMSLAVLSAAAAGGGVELTWRALGDKALGLSHPEQVQLAAAALSAAT